MSALALLGKDFEHLSELITNQINFNSSLDANKLYDEITEHLETLESDKVIVSFLHNKVNPIKIVKTDNFQFMYDNCMTVAIANKYF